MPPRSHVKISGLVVTSHVVTSISHLPPPLSFSDPGQTDLDTGFPFCKILQNPCRNGKTGRLSCRGCAPRPSHIHEQATCIDTPHSGVHPVHHYTPPRGEVDSHAAPLSVTQLHGAENRWLHFAFFLDVWPKKVVLRCLPHAASCILHPA